MFNAEVSVVVESKVFPKLLDISRSLWIVYVGLTFILTILLLLGGLDLFDSLSHSFSTIATGGFSTKNDSIGAFSPLVQYLIAIFMILSGINFSLYVFLFKKNFSKVFLNEELKFFIILILVVTLLIFGSLLLSRQNPNVETTFREAFFQTVSILTTTGFHTSDYLEWNNFAMVLIIILMFTGACAGSTTCNIKIIRHVIIFKSIRGYLKKMMHPDAVTVVRYNKTVITPEIANNTLIFIVTYFAILAISVLIISFTGIDVETSIGCVVSTLGCIGPGIGKVGPMGNYGFLHPFGKFFLSFLMILGRLEIFTVLIIFTRGFWKG